MVDLKISSLEIYVEEKGILFKDADGERKHDIFVIKNPAVADMLSYYDEIHIRQLSLSPGYVAILFAYLCCCLKENGIIYYADSINPAILFSTNGCLNRWDEVNKNTKSLGQSFGRLVKGESCFVKNVPSLN